MKSEKHRWKKERIYYRFFGDTENHFYEDILVCSDCGARKMKECKK